jgi:hypothetical protein
MGEKRKKKFLELMVKKSISSIKLLAHVGFEFGVFNAKFQQKENQTKSFQI